MGLDKLKIVSDSSNATLQGYKKYINVSLLDNVPHFSGNAPFFFKFIAF